MKLLSFTILLFLGTFLYAQNTDIRGQVVSYNTYYKNYPPASNMRVNLSQNNRFINSTYTDAGGIYYFYNITPGSYILQINNRVYNINVHHINKRNQQFQDISRILLP